MENIQRFERITFWFAPVYSVDEKGLLGIFRADCVYTLCDIQCINTVINYSYHAVYNRLHYYVHGMCMYTSLPGIWLVLCTTSAGGRVCRPVDQH